MKDSHGLVPRTPSSQYPTPKPITRANTNDKPIVLSCPMSCNVVGDVGSMAQCNGFHPPVPGILRLRLPERPRQRVTS